MPVNPNRLAQFFWDEWNATEQPLVERGSAAPLGKYQDGSYHMAVPGVLYDTAQGANALWEQSKFLSENPEYSSDPELQKAMAGNSLMAAGLAATGGVGASAVGGAERNAMMSNVGRELPQDFAPIRTYRGTNKELNQDVLGQRGRYYASDRPEVANAYAFDKSLDAGVPPYEGTAVYPVEFFGRQKSFDEYPGPMAIDQARNEGFDFLTYPGDIPGSTEYQAIRPNTVRSAMTGETLFANPKESAIAPALINAMDDPKGITAYHGSPHDFDKFSLDKIGTGEGAQAYGHGLYFAENEGVARSYRDKLATPTASSAVVGDWVTSGASDATRMTLSAHGGDIDVAIADAVQKAGQGGRLGSRYEPIAQELQAIKAAGPRPPDGRMYQVRLNAEPESFLDWDKPLSGQSEAVRKALEGLPGLADHDMAMVADHLTGGHALQRARVGGADDVNAAALREAGIPGIRYLDQGSRTAGEGSYNYTVFDDALIEIMKKYSNPPQAMAVPLGVQQSQDDSNDPMLNSLLKRYGVQY